MRIVIHDFIGHAFPVGLSRELAARGHSVLHLHFPPFETPKGILEARPEDPAGLAIEGLSIAQPYEKYSFVKRFLQEREYTRVCAERIKTFAPDVVLSGNATPVVQAGLMTACHKGGIAFVPWVQDFHGIAIGTILAKKFGFLGKVAGGYFQAQDDRVLAESEQVVFITEDFCSVSKVKGLAEKMHVIENWAPIEELPVREKQNQWRERHGLVGKFVFLYSGTLGLKHNPGLLLELALKFRGNAGVAVVVVTQGIGRKWLEEKRQEHRLTNLVLLDFQPFEDLPDVVAAGDALVAVVEREAGVFCVPSKVLTYLCAARPILLAVPGENLAARTVLQSGGGLVVEPDDVKGFVNAAESLVKDPRVGQRMGQSGRKFAEVLFDIKSITTRFESVFARAVAGRGPSGSLAELSARAES